MRIALVHSRLLWQGGLETRLFSYMRYLLENGHEVTVITYKVGEGVELPEGARLIHVNLKLIPRELRPWFFDRRLKTLVATEGFDFVLSLTKTSHQDAVLAPGNHLGFMKATAKRRYTIIDRMLVGLERRAFNRTPLVLAASTMMKDELVEHYRTDPRSIEVLFPPIDNTRFNHRLAGEKKQLRAKYRMDPNKKSFVLVSISHWRKGLPLLLEIFKELQDEPYELIVSGVQEVDSDLPNVQYVGFVSETEELYAAADYSILPALYEPFGQVVAESLMCGTPVLVSHMVGAKEVVSEREGLVIPSLEPKPWIQAIRGLGSHRFDISEKFGEEHGLNLGLHVERILKLASRSRKPQTYT